jgi:SulP family sulfate permease
VWTNILAAPSPSFVVSLAAMPSRLLAGRDAEQPLPFTGDSTSDADFAQDILHAENGGQTPPQSRPIRAHSITAQTLSGSYTRNPIRSFAHQTSHGFAGENDYASFHVHPLTAV